MSSPKYTPEKKHGWVANRGADDLIRCRAHYDVTVMCVAESYIPPAFIYPVNHNIMALFPYHAPVYVYV